MVRGRAVVALVALLWMGSFGLVAADADVTVPDLPTVVTAALPSGRMASTAEAAQMQFVCPDPGTTALGQTSPQENARVTTVYGCPYRIYDGDNPFGNIALAVRSDNAGQVAFAALHGNPAPDGPSEVARSGQTHTTFTSSDQGATWYDEPTPESWPSQVARGEESDIVMDEAGNIYVLYKWSRPGTGGWTGFLGLFKGGNPMDRGSVQESYLYRHMVYPLEDGDHAQDPRYNPGGSIDVGGLVHILDTNAPPPPEYRNDTDVYGEEGDAAIDVVPTDERIAAVWLERTAHNKTNADGWTGWIDAAWTDTSTSGKWTQLNATERIGPCQDASRPVAYRGDAYVVCTVAKGYDARSRARIGDHDIWRIDLKTGTTKFIAKTGLAGGTPLLAVADDGYMVLGTYRVEERGVDKVLMPEVHFAYGWYGKVWSKAADVGPGLHDLADAGPILDAHVTALEVTSDQHIVYAVYQERLAQGAPEAPGFDAEDPLSTVPHLTDYRKLLLAFDECGNFPIAAAEFDLGGAMDVYNYEAYQQANGTYNDAHDGLAVVRDLGSGAEILYFAINDYGAAQYGATYVDSAGTICPTIAPILPAAPAAIPQALTLATPAATAAGILLGLPLAGMVGYLLTVKRRTAQYATAEDER